MPTTFSVDQAGGFGKKKKYGTLPTKQPRGLLIQGWHYIHLTYNIAMGKSQFLRTVNHLFLWTIYTMAMSQHPIPSPQVRRPGRRRSAPRGRRRCAAAPPRCRSDRRRRRSLRRRRSRPRQTLRDFGRFRDFTSKIWGDFTWFTIWLFNIAMENHHF